MNVRFYCIGQLHKNAFLVWKRQIFFHLLDFDTALYLLPLCNITKSVNYQWLNKFTAEVNSCDTFFLIVERTERIHSLSLENSDRSR